MAHGSMDARLPRRWGVRVGMVLGTAVLGWLLFGWTVDELAGQGRLRYQRVLGRSVLLTVDEDRDGRIDGRYVYSWFRPADRPHTRPVRFQEDRNRDGVWDVWVRETGKNKYGDDELEFRVDVTGDGVPDWTFRSLDVLSGYQVIVEARGY